MISIEFRYIKYELGGGGVVKKNYGVDLFLHMQSEL